MSAGVRSAPSFARRCWRALAMTASAAVFAAGSVLYALFIIVISTLLAVCGGLYYALVRFVPRRSVSRRQEGEK